MKKFALAAVVSVAATAGFAGTIEEPVIEPVIVEEETGTQGGWLVPLVLLIIAAAAASS